MKLLQGLIFSTILGACATIPDDWLFSNNTLLSGLCGATLETAEIKLDTKIHSISHRWATHVLSKGRQRILLRFDGGLLSSYEAMFDIPGRTASASLGNRQCLASEISSH